MDVHIRNDVETEGKFLIEGFPGIGLVAKIATDQLIQQLDTELYAEVFGDEVPEICMFDNDGHRLRSPVRIYAVKNEDILILTSDAPISSASPLMESISQWIEDNDVLPIYQLGLPTVAEENRDRLFGVSTGDADSILEAKAIESPPGKGMIAGPTGGLLKRAAAHEIDGIGLTVASDPQLPDPRAAKKLLDEGLKEIIGLEVDTAELEKSAEKIREKKKRMAEEVQRAEQHEKSQAYPSEMYG